MKAIHSVSILAYHLNAGRMIVCGAVIANSNTLICADKVLHCFKTFNFNAISTGQLFGEN
jgi:hypothetical protein